VQDRVRKGSISAAHTEEMVIAALVLFSAKEKRALTECWKVEQVTTHG